MDQVMADLATVESKCVPPKRKRDDQAKESMTETPTSVLKHSDPSKRKYGPDPSKTIYGPATNYRSGNRSYYRSSQSSNDYNSRNRNDQNRGANNRYDQNNRSRNYGHKVTKMIVIAVM